MSKNKITITLDEADIKELLRMRRERDEPERVVFVPYYIPPPNFVPWFGIVPPSDSTAAPFVPTWTVTSTSDRIVLS